MITTNEVVVPMLLAQGVATLDVVVIVGYLIILAAVGIATRSMNRDVSDYFRNGAQGKWWLIGTSAFMIAFSAWTFTGAAGVAFDSGWSVMAIFLGNACGFLVNAMVTAPWFRQCRVITVPEVIRDRFDVTTQQFYAWVSVGLAWLFSSLSLYGLAIFTSAVFGIDIMLVILGVGLIVLGYSTLGGSWAVMTTDYLQGLVLVPMTILVTVLCLLELGGVGGLFERVEAAGLSSDFALVNEPGRFPMEAFTLGWVLAMFVKNTVTYNTLHAAARYFAVKDGTEARWAAGLACVLMAAGSLVWFIPPMTARLLYEDRVLGMDIPKPAESAYAVAAVEVLPSGMVGLMVVAIFAATMSSIDTGLNRNAAIVTRDIGPALLRLFRLREASDRAMFRLGQVTTLCFGVLTILTAMYFVGVGGRGVFDLMITVAALLGLPMATPMLLALFIRRAPSWSAIASAGGALGASLVALQAEWGLYGMEPWSFQTKVFVNLGVGMGVFFLCMLFWPLSSPAYRERVRRFFERMRTPIDFVQEVGAGNDERQLRLAGKFGVVVAGLIALAGLLSTDSSLTQRFGALLVAAFVAAVSALMWVRARAGTRKQIATLEGEHKVTSGSDA